MTRTPKKPNSLRKAALTSTRAKIPAAVSRSYAREKLTEIVNYVAAGNTVTVGSSTKTSYSEFLPLKKFDEQRVLFSAEAEEINIEELRRKWSFNREQVENTGRPLLILRNSKPLAALVPTKRAMEKKIGPARDLYDKGHDGPLQIMLKKMENFENRLDDISRRTPSEAELKKYRRTITLAEQVLQEWRRNQNYPSTLPDIP